MWTAGPCLISLYIEMKRDQENLEERRKKVYLEKTPDSSSTVKYIDISQMLFDKNERETHAQIQFTDTNFINDRVERER